ncbi:Aldo-keto reductase [Zea mays]|uniref:Aldo-keto reductase n=1 Tax=Zea mays TaxID=4577 RepID=A0A3L6DNH3_MAIZE|nr:Aldo-keto reductase [Zea mays]
MLGEQVVGPSWQMTWIHGGPSSLDSWNIAAAIDGSLRRLGVDYIDLYQIHWPDQYVPMFGETEYDPNCQYMSVPMEEQLEALGRAIDASKVMSSRISLLAYSPMAMGILSRKYHLSDNCGPPDARMNLFKGTGDTLR